MEQIFKTHSISVLCCFSSQLSCCMFKLAFRAIAAMSTYKQAAGGRYWSSVESMLIHLPLFLFFSSAAGDGQSI